LKKKIKIITDSPSDIPVDLLKKFEILDLPLSVHFDGKDFKDGVDISGHEFFEMMKNSTKFPRTSPIPTHELIGVFDKLLLEYEHVIMISLSAKGSETFHNAEVAASTVSKDRISVIDSKGYSFGYGLIVLQAAAMVKQNIDLTEILKGVNILIGRMNSFFTLDTLEYLKRGGRISSARAAIGTLLSVKPILTVKDGEILVHTTVRGRPAVVPKMIELMKERIGSGNDLSRVTVGIGHGLNEETARVLEKEIRKEFKPKNIIFAETGTVIGAHTGPGVIGVFFLT